MKKLILSLMIASGILTGTGYAQNVLSAAKVQSAQTPTAATAKPEVKKDDRAAGKSAAKKVHKKHKKHKNKKKGTAKKAAEKTAPSKATVQK